MNLDNRVLAGDGASGLESDRFSRFSGEAADRNVDGEDVRAFERALKGADDEKAPQPLPGKDAERCEEEPEPRPASSGDKARVPAPPRREKAVQSGEGRAKATPLSGEDFVNALFSRASTAELVPTGAVLTAAAGGEVREAGTAGLDERALTQLVNRILVGSTQKGTNEVRLYLNDDVLRGTEITVGRDTAGALKVNIATRDDASFQTLVGARLDLERALQAAEKMPVVLDLRREDGDDANRRSRGLEQLEDPE